MKRTAYTPKLGKEQVLEAAKLTNPEARFVVANYYAAQEMRKRADMQIRHLGERDDVAPGVAVLLQYTADCYAEQEATVKRMLEKYASATPVGRWCLAQRGIGPVISAGLLAHINIERAPTAGHIWSFAGLNPEMKWEKGQKRPYNADLKQICFHIGECIKRTSISTNSLYGRLYQEYKASLIARNDRGGFAETAARYITQSAEQKAVLATGKVPNGYMDRMACRRTTKIFLSHLHAVMYWYHYNQAPPKPFAIAIQGHVHEIMIPMAGDFFPGFMEAYYGRKPGDVA
jgi:hypothetical protein